MQKDIRFIQRYEYFGLALTRLTEAVEIREMTDLESNGFVQRFEFTLELAWKTMRDFLIEEGLQVGSPKDTMRQAYASGYIDDAQVWMDMIDTRNAFSHDYDGHFFIQKETFLREDAYTALSRLYDFFTTKIGV